MPTFDFACTKGHLFESWIPNRDSAPPRCPKCGRKSERQFSPTSAIVVPSYMRAPGSVGSTSEAAERHKNSLSSERHRKMKQQDERIYERTSRAQQSFEKKMKDDQWKIDYLRETGRKPTKEDKP